MRRSLKKGHYVKVDGQKLKARRLSMGITQRQLADYAGLSTQTIINLELGRHGTNSQNLMKIVAGLNRMTIGGADITAISPLKSADLIVS